MDVVCSGKTCSHRETTQLPVAPDPTALPRDPEIAAMLEAAGVWMWEADLIEETTVYQDGFWEQYGFEPNSLVETFDFLRVVQNEDKREMTRAWRAHLDGETPLYESEWRLRTPDGGVRWISARGKIFERDAEGRPAKMVGIYRDITQARESEHSLAASAAELDAIFRSARHGLALISADFTVLRANAQARSLVKVFTGIELHDGDSILDLPGAAPDRPITRDIQAVFAGREVPERTLFVSASHHWVELAYAPVGDLEGALIGVVVTLRDVTEQRRLEQTRVQTLRMESMGLMASGIAHDFNNLLGAIIGNIDVACLDVSDPEVSESLSEARSAAQRAAELVDQLLAFANQHEPIVRPVDVSRLTAEIIRYARKIPGRAITITEELTPGLPQIDADATQLRQLVLNLLVNAIDATRERGSLITVRTFAVEHPEDVASDLVASPRPAPRYLALQVSDDGPGMDEATRAQIFDPFFSTKPNGHGLGLATVLGAARAHGGTVAVESTPGNGATFTVFLPAPP
jgi:PAS domain S-box-containing protein